MTSLPISERGYENPQLLVETEWLAQHLNDDNLRIVDTRAADPYTAGHIPGAASLAAAGGIPRAENNDMGTPDEFERVAGNLGVTQDSTVIVYDAPGAAMGMAAWAFLFYGHPDVRILDGGLEKWTREGRPVSTEPSTYPPGSFEANPVEELYCSLEDAKAAHGQPAVIFWDTRTTGEHEGSAAVGNNPRPGHIPGAIHLEWIELLDPDTKTLKPAGELRSLLQSRGITPESEINCY
jgi:thiosulfate/3-mercaptopyruvate sulfurtransferase